MALNRSRPAARLPGGRRISRAIQGIPQERAATVRMAARAAQESIVIIRPDGGRLNAISIWEILRAAVAAVMIQAAVAVAIRNGCTLRATLLSVHQSR